MIRKRTVSAPCSNSRLSSLNFENDISPRTRIKRNRPASFTEARRVTNRQGGEISSPFCNPSSSSSSSSGRYVGKLPVVLTWNANNLRARLVGLGGKGGSSVGVGGGGEGLKDLAILHNVDIICIQEVCMDITALQHHLSPLPSSSGAAPTRESDLSTRNNNNGRTSSERMQITPPRRRRVQHRQGEGGDEVSIRRIAPELSSANYIIETRSAPHWLPEDFRMSVWSLNGDEDNKGKAKGKGVGVIMRSSWAPENFERALGFSLDDPELESHARFSEGRCITLQLREELVLLVTYSPQDSFNTCRSCSAIDMLEGGHGGIGTSERRKLLNQSQIPCFRTQVWDRALRKYISSLLSEPRKKHLIWCGDMNALHDVKKDRLFRNRGEGASAKSYVYLHVPKGNRAEKEKVKELGGVFPPHIEMDEKRGANSFMWAVPPGLDPSAFERWWPKEVRVTRNFRKYFDLLGLVDAFRCLHPKNNGHHGEDDECFTNLPCRRTRLRLDYFIVSPSLKSRLAECIIDRHSCGSDHLPVILKFKAQ